MLKIVVPLVLLGHAIGHSMGFLASWTEIKCGFTEAPWILSPGVTISGWVGRAFGVLWLVALIAFGAGLFGMVGHQAWWRTAMLFGALVSLVVVVPWWNTVTPGARYGATLVDLLILAALFLPAASWVFADF